MPRKRNAALIVTNLCLRNPCDYEGAEHFKEERSIDFSSFLLLSLVKENLQNSREQEVRLCTFVLHFVMYLNDMLKFLRINPNAVMRDSLILMFDYNFFRAIK